MKKKLFPTSGHQAAYDVLRQNEIYTTTERERKKEKVEAKEPTKQSVNETRRNAAPSNTTCTSQIKNKQKNLKGKKSNQMRKKKGDDEKKMKT